MKFRKLFALLLLIAVLGLAITLLINRNNTEGDGGKLQVSATFYPLYEFARSVGGDKVTVSNLTPAGAEPHDYEPSPTTLIKAKEADVFIFNGGTFEPWVNNFLKDYKYSNRHVSVLAGSGISLRYGNDPHYWLDPVLAKDMVINIRNGFIKADPENKDYYTEQAAAYTAKLDRLDEDFKSGLSACSLGTVISSHEAFGYLADRYDFDVEAIAGLSPEEEPSAARLAELSDLVKQRGIRHIFFESLVSPRLADTIATETGAKTLVFDPIEGLTHEDQKAGKNYLSVQRQNLGSLRTALSCK